MKRSPECNCSKLIEDRRVHIWIVSGFGVSEITKSLAAKNIGKIFSVGDLLKLSTNKCSGKLERGIMKKTEGASSPQR